MSLTLKYSLSDKFLHVRIRLIYFVTKRDRLSPMLLEKSDLEIYHLSK